MSTGPARLRLSAARLALLGSRLREEGLERAAPAAVARRADPLAPVPLTPPQRQMWVLEQLMTGTSPYVILGGLRVHGGVDTTVFADACRHVVRRHEALRTVVVETDGVPCQVVRADLPPQVRVEDLRGTGPVDVERLVTERQRAAAREPFDLTTGPLLRIDLVRTADEESVLLFALHHIVSDLWSMGVLMRDVMESYAAVTQGRSPRLEPLSVQFADHAAAVHRAADDAATRREVEHWLQRLRGAPADTGIVTDDARPTEASYRGTSAPVEVPLDVVAAARALAQAEGSTVYLVLTAVFTAFLARLGGRDDVVIGTPVAGRRSADLDPVIGCFVNTVALRTDVSGDPTFRELLHRVTQVGLEALEHQWLPFERVVAELRPERHLARNPVFQVMLSYQNAPLPAWDAGVLRVEPVPAGAVTAKVDLQLDLVEDGPRVWGRLVCSTDLFDERRAADLADALQRLLGSAVRDPDQRVGDLPLLDEAGTERVLALGRGAPLAPPAAATVHELVARTAAAQPDDVAVVADGTRTTYRELLATAERLAALLQHAGVRPGAVVGLALPTGVALVAAILATWRTGAAYLPIDPRWPAERVRFVLTDARAVAVVSPVGLLPAGGEPAGDDDGLVVGRTGTPRPSDHAPDAPGAAYVMYTSGSTGAPKGVQVTHAGLLAYLAAVPARMGLGGRGTRYAVLQGMVADFAHTLVLTSLVTGGELHLLDRDTATDPHAVADLLARERIDCMKIVPSHLAALATGVDLARLWPARTLVLGGEAAGIEQARALADAAAGRRLHNHYGPTETTIGVTTALLTPHVLARGVVPVGTPVPGARLYVLDLRGRPVPIGVVGELHVGGPQVAHGYVGRPDLTAERFVDDPFAGGGARMYRTGDRASWTIDGDLRLHGRADGQLKVRGFRVEPGEVEAALAADPLVDRAVAVLRADDGGPRLVAYVTATGPVAPDPGDLRRQAAATLPEHLVPSAVVVLETWPLTSNGKVDRAALPAPAAVTPALRRAPGTATERVVCGAVSEVLGLSVVGPDDGFFELGGDSIQAIALVSRLRAAGLELGTRDVFVHQTPAGLAAAIDAGTGAARLPHDPGLGEVPSTPVMERLRATGADIRRYSHRVVVTVPPQAGLEDLTAALGAVVEHHGALRSRLVVAQDGTWRLVVGEFRPEDVPRLVRVDAAGITADELGALVTRSAAAAVGRLDPAAGTDVQAVWFDAGGTAPGHLLLVVHHLAVDGVSWRVLLGDLRAAWQAQRSGRQAHLTAVGTSARRWAELLHEEAALPRRRAELPAWTATLEAGAPVVGGRHDSAAPVRTHREVLPAATTAALLRRVPAVLGVATQDLLLAALGIAVGHRLRPAGAAEQGLVVEVETHGRDLDGDVDLSRTVGWLTSVHPVLLGTGGLDPHDVDAAGPRLRSAVVDAVRRTRDAVPGDGRGYGLLRYLDPVTVPTLAALPDPQVVLNYLGRMVAPDASSSWQPVAALGPRTSDPEAGLGPLLTRPLQVDVLVVEESDGPRLVAEWRWAGQLFDEGAVPELARAWVHVVDRIAACVGDDVPATSTDPSAGGRRPLSFPQLNNVHQPAGADNAHHNVVAAVSLTPDPAAPHGLDEALLARSLAVVVERHEVLRTRVLQDADGWYQVVRPDGTWPVRTVDARALDDAGRARTLDDVVREEQTRPFRLADGEPVRTTVVRMADDEWVLIMVLHHIVIDPWGYAQLQHELAELYEAGLTGRTPHLPELGAQYADLAGEQQARLDDGSLAPHTRYWERLLLDRPAAPRFEPPAWPPPEPFAGFTSAFTLDETVTARIRAAARGHGATPFMLLLAAYQALQAVCSGANDVLVTVPLAGREQPEARHLIGYFINEVVVRTRTPSTASFAGLLGDVRDGMLDGHAHQDAPLRALHGHEPGSCDPFRIMFNLVNYAPIALDLHGLRAAPLTQVAQGSDDQMIPEVITAMRPHNLDLYLAMHERDGRLHGIWLYSPQLVPPSVMAAMVEVWPRLLDAVLRDGDVTVAQLRRALWTGAAPATGSLA